MAGLRASLSKLARAALALATGAIATGAHAQQWDTLTLDNMSSGSTMDLLVLQAAGPAPTGLIVHRKTNSCTSIDVELAPNAPAMLRLRQYRGDQPEGNAARSLQGVSMTGTGTADRHVRVMVASGTSLTVGATVFATLAVSASSTCSGSQPGAVAVTGRAVVTGTGLATQEATQGSNATALRRIGTETLDAIMLRMDAVADASAATDLRGLAAIQVRDPQAGLDLRDLAGHDFVLGLNQRASDGPLKAGNLALWGRFGLYALEAVTDGGVKHDSDQLSASFGLDYRFRDDMLLGFGYGHHGFEGGYAGHHEVAGDYVLDVNVLQPYAVGRFGPPGWLAAYASMGKGEMRVSNGDGLPAGEYEVDYSGWGFGWRHELRQGLRLRAGASGGELDAEDGELYLDVAAGAAQLAVGYAVGAELIKGAELHPVIEVAWVDKWGDAATEATWLFAAAFEYAGEGPMHIRAGYRRAMAGDSLSGAEIDARIAPARGGLGPSLALRPSYGLPRGDELLPDASALTLPSAAGHRSARLDAEFAWGLPVNGGVATPYSEWSLDSDQGHEGGLGLRLGAGAYGDWNLGWRRTSSAADELHLELRIGE